MRLAVFVVITALYASISAYGLYLVKDASDLLSVRALVGGVFYGSGFVVWLAILRLFPLTIAFPVAAGSLIVATHLIARIQLAETVTALQMVGLGMIVGGILLVSLRIS